MRKIGDLTVILRARSGDRRDRSSEGLDRRSAIRGLGGLETWRPFSARGLETGASGRVVKGFTYGLEKRGCGGMETWRSFSARGLETGASEGKYTDLYYPDGTHRLTWIEPFDLLLF